MIGRPKFTYNDFVEFECNGHVLRGRVEIIDSYGTFFDDSDVSYDIMVDNSPHYGGGPCLYKHITESKVKKVYE